MLRRLGVLLPILGAACTGLGGLTSQSDDAGATSNADGSPSVDGEAPPIGADSSSPVDGGADSSVAGSLVANGGFEEGAGGCGPGWRPDRTTMTRSNEARSGMFSCLVCINPGNDIANVFPLNEDLATVKAGDTYYAEAWVAAPPMGAAVPKVAIQLTVDDVNLDYGSTVPQPDWQVVQIQGTASGSGVLGFALRGETAPSSTNVCYLVDDIVVIKQ